MRVVSFVIFLFISFGFHILVLSYLEAFPGGKVRPVLRGDVMRAKIISGKLFMRGEIAKGGTARGRNGKGLRMVETIKKGKKSEIEGEASGPSFEDVVKVFGGEEVSPVYLYLEKIKNIIKSNWNLPPALKENVKGLKCKILLKIRRDGKVVSKEFILRSGSEVYDFSAMRAIEKSSPLPPFPAGVLDEEIQVEVEF